MATVYGVNATLKATGTVNTIDPELVGAKMQWFYDEYEASALAAGSVIEMFGAKLPAGGRVVDWVLDHDALDCLEVFIGTKADDNEFMASTDCVAADKKNMTDDGVAAALGFEIASGDGQTVIITVSGATAATGTIKFAMLVATKA